MIKNVVLMIVGLVVGSIAGGVFVAIDQNKIYEKMYANQMMYTVHLALEAETKGCELEVVKRFEADLPEFIRELSKHRSGSNRVALNDAKFYIAHRGLSMPPDVDAILEPIEALTCQNPRFHQES